MVIVCCRNTIKTSLALNLRMVCMRARNVRTLPTCSTETISIELDLIWNRLIDHIPSKLSSLKSSRGSPVLLLLWFMLNGRYSFVNSSGPFSMYATDSIFRNCNLFFSSTFLLSLSIDLRTLSCCSSSWLCLRVSGVDVPFVCVVLLTAPRPSTLDRGMWPLVRDSFSLPDNSSLLP